MQADLTDPDGAASAVAAVEDLGAVVNLVGGFDMGPKVHETEPEAFERQMRLNLTPAFLLARAAMPAWSRRAAEASSASRHGPRSGLPVT